MNNPSKTKYAWVSLVKEMPFLLLLLGLFILYLFINIAFGITYYSITALKPEATLLDNIYFSFVTALTIGYGDFYPLTSLGRVLVILQSCITALYFAVMISALSANMFYPKNTIYFSTKLLFNPQTDKFGIRILNSHKEKLVNPEIRIYLTEHCHKNVIATTHSVLKYDQMPYLGIHDFSLFFPNVIEVFTETGVDKLIIYDQIQMALEHNKNESEKSRFRIIISISGTYGIQHIAGYKRYYANDLEIGKSFKAVQYNQEVQKKWGNIRYTKFPNFWSDFNTIIKE